jgi:hypothetical protein
MWGDPDSKPMKIEKSGAVTALVALGFFTFLGFSIWVWISYFAHQGSLEQAGEAIVGVPSASITLGLGFYLWERTKPSKKSTAKSPEQPK